MLKVDQQRVWDLLLHGCHCTWYCFTLMNYWPYQQQPPYFFSLFKAPQKIIDILEAKRRKFFWSSSGESNGIAWISWDQILQPKKLGGLGLTSLKDYNIALLSKWWWRYKVEENRLWRKLIFAIHNSNRSWPALPHKKQYTGVWNNIAKIENHLVHSGVNLHHLIKGNLGSGASIRFWLDPWVTEKPFKDLFPDLYAIENCKSVFVCNCFQVQVQHVQWKWRWKRAPSSQEEVQQLHLCINALEQAKPNNNKDTWIWVNNQSQGFSVRDMKRLLQPPSVEDFRLAHTWNNWVPLKTNIFGWRAIQERLPTKKALARRGVNIDSTTCPICNFNEEDMEHLLTACEPTNQLWNQISSTL